MNRTEQNKIKRDRIRDIIAMALIIPDGRYLDGLSYEEIEELHSKCAPLFEYLQEKNYKSEPAPYLGRREDLK